MAGPGVPEGLVVLLAAPAPAWALAVAGTCAPEGLSVLLAAPAPAWAFAVAGTCAPEPPGAGVTDGVGVPVPVPVPEPEPEPEPEGTVDGRVTVAQYWVTVSPLALAAAARLRKATEWLAAWEPLDAA